MRCSGGSSTSCVDQNIYSGWTTGFWPAGSTVQVISGAASGCSTTISSFTGPSNGAGGIYTFASPCANAIGSGDYLTIQQTVNSNLNPTFGFWPSTTGNGTFSVDTADLAPGTTGIQALQVNAPTPNDGCSLSSFFDADSNGRSFLNLNGSFQITFKAKGLAGNQQVAVSFYRGTTSYVSQTVTLTPNWGTYTVNFTASETGTQSGYAQLNLKTVGADSFYLDDVSLAQTNTSNSNPTVFRDSVVSTLQALKPGIIRMWDGAGLGNTLDNMLADQFGRSPTNFSEYYQNFYNGASYSVPEFLQLVQTVGDSAEPWIVLPITMTPSEASNFIDYLSGDSSSVYGAKRIAQGFSTPWTKVFPKIHLEFGNEAWNSTFDGGNIKDAGLYGARAQTVFGAMKANGNYDTAHTSLVLGGFFADSNYVQVTQNSCNNNDEIDVAPYMMNNPTDIASAANLFQPTLAEPQAYYANGTTSPGVTAEWISSGYFNVGNNAQSVNGGGMYLNLLAEANSTHPVPVSIYEENLSTTGGTISQSQLNSFASSMGAGLAVVSEQLLGIQNGVLNQNLFALTQFNFQRPDGSSVNLWGSVVDMGGPTNLRRPQYLTQQLANSAIAPGGTMLQSVQSGANPTWNQSLDNSVAMNGVNYIQSFAFQNGPAGNSIILLNLSLTTPYPVTFSGANAPSGTVQIQQLTSSNPTDTNENGNLVSINTSAAGNFNPAAAFSLPPDSMTVLTWNGTNSSQPAVITAVSVSSITASSATITWTTDQAASSQVQYGTTTAYGSSLGPNGRLGTAHSVTLSGLTPGTGYNFDVQSANAAGNLATSANFSFTTIAQAPIISAINATAITSTSATITWTTDQAASSQVQYGTTTGYGSSSGLNTALSSTHSVTLSGLAPGTAYNFDVQSANSAGNLATSANFSFTTITQAPIISAVNTTAITSTSATITWTTDQAASSQVQYGTTTGYGSTSGLNTAMSSIHSVTLSGLAPGTAYNFDVQSANSAGNLATSANFSFATVAQAPAISAVTASSITSTSAVITWTTDQAASSQVQYGTTTAYGSSSARNGSLRATHSVTLSGLAPGTVYNFDVQSANAAGNMATSANFNFTTGNQRGPQIRDVAFWGITGSSVTISWSTDAPSTSAIAYGTTPSLGQMSPVQPNLTNGHGATLNGLSGGTTYYFAAVSADANGNVGYSTTYSFTTIPTAPPIISGIVVVPGTNHQAQISWTTSVPAYSWVQFGSTTDYGKYSSGTLLTTQANPGMGWIPSGVIHYRLYSLDGYGNVAISPDYTFVEP